MDSNIEKLHFKNEVSKRFNIPIDLLDGDTVEEDYSKALALVSYKRGIDLSTIEVREETPEERKIRIIQELTPSRKSTTREAFIEWMQNNL